MKTFQFQIEYGIQDCYTHYVEAEREAAAQYKIKKLIVEKHGEWALPKATINLQRTWTLRADYMYEYDRLLANTKDAEGRLDETIDDIARMELQLDTLKEALVDRRADAEKAGDKLDAIEIRTHPLGG